MLVQIIDVLMGDMADNLLSNLVGIYLPQSSSHAKKYKFDKNQTNKDARTDPMSKKIKKGRKPADFQQELNKLFCAETGIEHYDLDMIAGME